MRGHGSTFRYGSLLMIVAIAAAGWVWVSQEPKPAYSQLHSAPSAMMRKAPSTGTASSQIQRANPAKKTESRMAGHGGTPSTRLKEESSKATLPAAVAAALRELIEEKKAEAARPESNAGGARGARPQPQTDAGGAMAYALRKRLPEGMTSLPTERYLEAYEEMRHSARYSTAEGRQLPAFADEPNARMSEAIAPEGGAQPTVGTWTPLGPGNIGGRTRGLVIDPGNPNVMYAAGVAGGIWKTTNGGTTWTPKADLLANIAVSSLAMDPTNSSVLYAGTGEGFFNVDAVRGAGIFKSTDAGETWTQLTNTATGSFATSFQYVNDIVVSPLNGQRVYAATRSGIFRSLDGGTTWSSTSAFGSDGCSDLVIRTDKPTDYIFAACFLFNSTARVYRNTDAGGNGTWDIVLGGVAFSDPDGPMGRTSLALAPSNQNTIYAMAMRASSGTFRYGLHAIFRSTTSGDPGSWTKQVDNSNATKLNTVQLSNPLIAFATECNQGTSAFLNQGWYDNVIAVDPLDPNRVWTGGIDLMRSDDGGVNWGLASYWWSSPPSAHADQHAIVFHPGYDGSSNKKMFVANDGGIFRTDDARAAVATGTTAACSASNTSVAWTELNNNYGVTQFYHGLPYPGGTTYFGGTQDNGTLRSNDGVGAEAWSMIKGGDGGYVAIDPGNTDVLYGANPGGGFFKSTNGGANFSSVVTGLDDSGFQFITPFVMDPNNAQRLWTAGIFIWRTDNGAANWSRASALTRGNGTATALAVKPGDSNTVLVGMSDGFINRNTAALSANDTTAWDFTQPRIGGNVSWLAFDPSNPQTVYATMSTFGGSHIYKSTDGGASWSQGMDLTRATGLPDIPVHSLAVDPNNSSRLYIGTDAGVYVSLDGGYSWMVENTGFANVVTEALAITDRSGTPNLFAFTHGRGVWRVPLNPVPTGPILTLMVPNRLIAGGPDAVVTVFGTNFANNSVVRWNGADRATTFVSGNRLTATIPAADVSSAGAGSVTVFNPTGGATSDPLTFTLDSGTNPNPFLLSISPTTVREGQGELMLTATLTSGTTTPSMRVRWNGQDRPTFQVNPAGASANSTLIALIPASDTASAGSALVSVFAPGPGGGTSTDKTITMGTPKMQMSGTSVSFGNVPTGTTTSSQTITLNNPGTLNLSITTISSSSCCNGSFNRTGTCSISTPVPPGGSCTFVYTYTSNTVGLSTGTLNVFTNAFNTPSASVSLSATGVGPGVNLSQGSISFGNQTVNTASGATTVVLNNGSANPITVNSIASDSNQFPQNNNCPVSPSTLNAGASCNINISFAPTSMGAKSGTVTVTDTGSGSPRTVTVTGTGTAILANFQPASLDFGGHVPGRNTLPKSFTLTNGGNLAMNISNITASGDFSRTHDCPGSLAAGAFCTITVTFQNTAPPGAANGAITITSNASGSPHTVNLTATVLNFTLSVSRPTRSRRNSTNGTGNVPETFEVAITPTSGVTGLLELACDGAPGISCAITPAAVQLAGQPVMARVAVTSAARSQRLRRYVRSQSAIVRVRATWQGVTQVLEIPVQVGR